MPFAEKYIDLHMHLDGAVTPDIARDLAELQGIELPARDEDELRRLLTVSEDCTSLSEFLQCFALPMSLMQTYEGLRECARLVAEDMRSKGVIYGEIRFAPQLHTTRGMTQEDAVLAVLEGVRQSSLKANVILCCMRGVGNEAENRETLVLTRKYLVEDGGVVAMDMAGAEAEYPTGAYRELFALARECGVPFTIHAGEADGPESVRLAVEFGARRIGHGVRAWEDESVLALVKERGVVLDMCPTSNRKTVAVKDMSRYPLQDFLARGIRVTLNTDDPGIEGTTIGEEFRYMERTLGLTEAQEKQLLKNAVDAAFTGEDVKNGLRRALGIDAEQ